jgi:hypothetical protein
MSMENCGIAKHRALTDDTQLYRYMGLSQFLSFVETKQTYITSIRRWQDTWEAPVFQIPVQRDDGELEYPFWAMAEDLSGQSWSLHPESDALWRVYSPQEEGLVIQTTVERFDLMSGIRFGLLAPVVYFENLLDGLTTIARDKEYDGPFQGGFLKRKAFEHEVEVRLVTLNSERCLGKRYKDCIHITVALDPLEFIEGITVDPRAEDWYVATLQKYCERAGFEIVPTKSELYSAGVFESTGVRIRLTPPDSEED